MRADSHPVLEKIDFDTPFFRRLIEWEDRGTVRECELQLWLPVQLDNGRWAVAVRIAGLDMPLISAMPGEDPLAALISALAFARDAIDREDGRFLFGDCEFGGLPVSLGLWRKSSRRT